MPRKNIHGKGIRFLQKKNKFEARVVYKGKRSDSKRHQIYVGEFDTLLAAQNARKQFIIDLF